MPEVGWHFILEEIEDAKMERQVKKSQFPLGIFILGKRTRKRLTPLFWIFEACNNLRTTARIIPCFRFLTSLLKLLRKNLLEAA